MGALLEAVTAVGSVALASAARRTAVFVVAMLASAALLLTSLAFFTLAAYRALAGAMGDIHAPLVVGGAYLLFGLVALLIVQSRR